MTSAVYKVEPGSLVVTDIEFENDTLEEFVASLREVAGHDRFLVLSAPPGSDAHVIGPEELKVMLREAL